MMRKKRDFNYSLPHLVYFVLVGGDIVPVEVGGRRSEVRGEMCPSRREVTTVLTDVPGGQTNRKHFSILPKK